ncbi:uncharacterized protein LOC120292215 [Eucalyptus grandis]|uniref:uncharacterized protein LOC120292215 n=1 Tax=Eucalyptus grandis TaxID=71139 RepID=UPI00192EF7CA|nr:uncharacterized protein LOC120292215 [Eucalyptus grandis]
MDDPFTIRFHLGVKKPSEGFEFAGGILREKKDVTPDSVTYEGLIADVKGFGFRMKRMWYETPGVYHELTIEIKNDGQVKGMVQLASKRGLIHLYVEGGFDSEWKGEFDNEILEMLSEEYRMKNDVFSDEDGVEWDVSGPDEYSDSASVGNSETDGTSSIDDFQSEPGDAKRFEDTGNRRQMTDRRIWHYGSVARRKTARMENRKKDNDESWEPANQNDVLRSSCQRCQGAEHDEKSCKAATEVEDQRHLSPVKRDRTVATNQLPKKTGRGSGAIYASSPGRDLAKRGRGRDIASSSRNNKSLSSGKDTTSIAGKYTASNSGRSISSISQSSVTSSLGWGRGSTSGRGTALSSGRDTNFILGRVEVQDQKGAQLIWAQVQVLAGA